MRIEEIGAYSYGAQVGRAKSRAKSNENSSKKAGLKKFAREDSYIPAGSKKVKAKNIEEVQTRVKQKFYNSDVVAEDLSNLFAKVLDR